MSGRTAHFSLSDPAMKNPSALETTFFAALDIASTSARKDFVDEACAGNPELRQQVNKMLAAHLSAGDFLAQPAVTIDAGIRNNPSITEAAGSVIGPYKLLQQIGEGGMGVVFMAEQLEPIRRIVALKIIKQGMDTRHVIARFEAERQALATMDHPNVAKVLDAGTTSGGRPYFVMELVKGVPITKYCDDRKLPLRARLDLFVPVCMAVQHAHQKGLIHRDIKPTNVLVAEYDDLAVPKVIDFGVAKAIAQPMTDRTLFTEYGQVVGTVEYMSPEQAKLNQLDIDTRSDIYSLGVLMYELLTGSTPFGLKLLKEAAFDEMLRIIREEDPQKPSTRLRTSEALQAIASNRGVETLKLNRLVRGELDWVVMKALEKDRNRRYETANGLAADVQRYLVDENVQACPPSAGYRLLKIARRNRAAFTAGSIVALALVLGILSTTWQALRATRERDRAVTAEAIAVNEAGQKEIALNASRKNERAKSEQLWESLVSEARATRLSRRPGQRFKSLEILEQANQLARSLDLPTEKIHEQRNAAIAALAVTDLYLNGPSNPWPVDGASVDFDEAHATYARTDREGNCSIRRFADDVEIHNLPGLGTSATPYLSPDGKHVAIVYANTKSTINQNESIPAVHVWQLDAATPRRIISEPQARGVAFHPNTRQIALAYKDGSIGLFDLSTGKQLSRLAPDAITRETTIALHPTEPVVAVCSYFGSIVQLRDLSTGKVLATLPQDRSPHSVVWSPDGKTLAVGLADATKIILYDRTTLQPFRTLDTISTATVVVFNHAGDRLVASGWLGIMELFDVNTGQKLFAISLAGGHHPVFSQDDRKLAGVVQTGKLGTTKLGTTKLGTTKLGAVKSNTAQIGIGQINIGQVGDGREYRSLVRNAASSEEQDYGNASVSPDGRLLAAATRNGIGLWDIFTGSELGFVPCNSPDNLVQFEPSGSLLTLTAGGLARWPVAKELNDAGQLIVGPAEQLPLPRGSFMGQSADGRVIVSCTRAVSFLRQYAGGWILHADRPNQPIRLDVGADIGSIAVSPDGRWVVTGTFAVGQVKIWNASTGTLVKQINGYWNSTPRFSPDNRWLSIGLETGQLYAVDTWEPVARSGLSIDKADIAGIGKVDIGGVFAPDSNLMAVPTPLGIRLLDRATGREVALLEAPNLDATDHITFTPDGTKLIAVARFTGIHVWDLRLIRQQLKEMGLDWDWPEFSAETTDIASPLPTAPGSVRFDAATFVLRDKAINALSEKTNPTSSPTSGPTTSPSK